jgi:hypothetical protein
MKDNEQELENIKKYVAYLKENFEVAESYFNMICRTFDNKEYESKINHLKELFEFLRQKVFNDNEINYNINTIKDNLDNVIAHYFNSCIEETNAIFNYMELEFKFNPIKL